MKTAERIAIPELKKRIDSGRGIVVVDVREKKELAESGRSPGALHIPIGQVEKHMEDFKKDTDIVFY